ncbi:MAG TPA: dTDP-glucose 4,6-dehydratase [Burkholderiales bacterium]
MTVLVTGGAGFIGSNFVLDWFARDAEPIVNLDKLTYAGNPANLEALKDNSAHVFVHGDICDKDRVQRLIERHTPRAIVHFAAESHVDRSIHGPAEFVQTNVVGTFSLLEQARAFWEKLPRPERDAFRFLHVSTDEVYGSLGPGDPPFSETTPYAPNSPYAASKAASDHLVRAFHHTYGLPALVTNCSNNYGPYQFPEKLVPLMILNALMGKPLPVYGDGKNVRDWVFVQDHCAAIRAVLAHGRAGETYNIGGNAEKTNLEMVDAICRLLDEAQPHRKTPHAELITFVKDRPGHDRRYAMDAGKMSREFGWKPAENFESGLRKTVAWFLDNPDWVAHVTSGAYRNWIEKNYAKRGAA